MCCCLLKRVRGNNSGERSIISPSGLPVFSASENIELVLTLACHQMVVCRYMPGSPDGVSYGEVEDKDNSPIGYLELRKLNQWGELGSFALGTVSTKQKLNCLEFCSS